MGVLKTSVVFLRSACAKKVAVVSPWASGILAGWVRHVHGPWNRASRPGATAWIRLISILQTRHSISSESIDRLLWKTPMWPGAACKNEATSNCIQATGNVVRVHNHQRSSKERSRWERYMSPAGGKYSSRNEMASWSDIPLRISVPKKDRDLFRSVKSCNKAPLLIRLPFNRRIW